MTLYLDRIRIKGHNLKLSVTLPLAGEDMSGTGSHTAQAETGDKAKEISVALAIAFDYPNYLTELVELAESKDSRDERRIFGIVNDTANAMRISQVRFQGELTVREADDLRQWEVAFSLVEYHSTAEKKEQRSKKLAKTKAKLAIPKPTGTPVSTSSGPTVTFDPNDPNGLTMFEKTIKAAQDKLK